MYVYGWIVFSHMWMLKKRVMNKFDCVVTALDSAELKFYTAIRLLD